MEEMQKSPLKDQREYLIQKGVVDPIQSYKQTDFVKERVAVEVQFGKYAFVAFDLFVKHLLFYSGDVINVGVEVLPVKAMAKDPDGVVSYLPVLRILRVRFITYFGTDEAVHQFLY